MKKQIVMTLMAIILFSFASAIYGGECEIVNVSGLNDVVYTVIGNSSNMDGMSVTIEGEVVSVCFDLTFKPDNFNLVFLDNSTREIIKTINNGGRSHTKYVDRDVIVYVPKYINNTIEVPVEKIVEVEKTTPCEDNVTVIEKTIFVNVKDWVSSGYHSVVNTVRSWIDWLFG